MSNITTIDSSILGSAGNGFNRTVTITPPGFGAGYRGTLSRAQEPDETTVSEAKKDIEDFVSGLDINPYISLDLDVSSTLESTLDDVSAKYAMLTEFAQGGTATLSIARDRNLRRLVAVKSLKKDAENLQERLKSFVTEAKVTAQLDHPGIIPIYGLSRDADDGIHLVMKLVAGKTLREYLRNIVMNYRIRGVDAFDPTVQLRTRLEIFLHVCDTIAYAHHRNVLHRDLKPENIMIGKYREVYVMDWGLATVVSKDDIRPSENQISGTPRYLSPELLRDDPLDLRSDIFTLGLILQEIVTLQYAVNGNDEVEFLDHILSGKLEPIVHLFGRKIDKTLKAIIRKATAHDAKDRYQTADDLAEDLRRYMGGFAVSVKPENMWDKFIRMSFFRR